MNSTNFLSVLFHNASLTEIFRNNTRNSLAATGNISSSAAGWSVSPVMSLINLIWGVIGNGTLLYLFIKNHSLQTPFNIYVMNLLFSNLVCIIMEYPFDVTTSLYGGAWYWGDHACTYYLYALYVQQGVICHAHVLIALNRVWAVTRPLSYRRVHSVPVAIGLCLVMWAYVQIVSGFGWAYDALYNRLPVEANGCQINMPQQKVWVEIYTYTMMFFPLIFMVASFPAIWLVRRAKQRRSHPVESQHVGQNAVRTNDMTETAGTVNTSAETPASSEHVEMVLMKSNPVGAAPSGGPPGPVPSTNAVIAMRGTPRQRQNRQGSNGFLVLGLLTASVTVFWTANALYDPIYHKLLDDPDFGTVPHPDFELYVQIAAVTFSCQSSMDPILFTLAIKDLRHSLWSLLFHN